MCTHLVGICMTCFFFFSDHLSYGAFHSVVHSRHFEGTDVQACGFQIEGFPVLNMALPECTSNRLTPCNNRKELDFILLSLKRAGLTYNAPSSS